MEKTVKNKNVNNIIECITENNLQNEESILSLIPAKLSVITNDKVIPFEDEGFLTVMVNRKFHCLFLKLFDFLTLKGIFEIEIYKNLCEKTKKGAGKGVKQSKDEHEKKIFPLQINPLFLQTYKNQVSLSVKITVYGSIP